MVVTVHRPDPRRGQPVIGNPAIGCCACLRLWRQAWKRGCGKWLILSLSLRRRRPCPAGENLTRQEAGPKNENPPDRGLGGPYGRTVGADFVGTYMAATPQVSRGSVKNRERVAVYVDGFNMYHALSDLKRPELKWLNLQRLADLLISRRSQQIVKVCYFSAAPEHFQNTASVDKLLRHRAYIAALESKGVEYIAGAFADRTKTYRDGKKFLARWQGHEEKQTDVAIACNILNDAYRDVYDRALLVCLDTDQLPTYKMMKALFPHKPVICVAPPHRAHHQDLQIEAAGIASIKVSQIEKALFGREVRRGGKVIAKRPAAYRP